MSEKSINPVDLRSQAAAREKTEREKKLARQQEIEDVRWLMSHPQGRRIAWRILASAGVFQTTFRLNNEMAFLEGRRSLGLEILGDVQGYALKEFVNMLEERKRE